MYVRCTHCGYDNSPEYRFCGMCGASLAHPPAETQPSVREAPHAGNGGGSENVHGPSFLGLAEDPKTEFHYLYEDEAPRSHVGLVFFLLLMFGAAGYLGWQWRHNGFPFNRLNASSSSGSSQSASPSEVAPAMSQNQETHIDKPMTGAGDVLPTQPDQKTPGETQGKPNNDAASQTPAGGGVPAKGKAPATEKSAEGSAETATEKATEKTETAEATPPPAPAEKARVPKHATPRASKTPSPEPSGPTAAPDADLELTGERYLYGNGVPQNCPRAESSLRTAALHGNSKAQTVLGTMYATGHCVGRDLPTAYRWFARALHQDPQNSRISADLQVLWRQMSPQEKQLATAAGQ